MIDMNIQSKPAIPASSRRIDSLNCLLLLLLLLVRFWCSPRLAACLNGVPDNVEYVVGAERIVHLHQFNIAINGAVYPSRYAPWFSLLFLAPIQAMVPHQPGIGILLVLAMSLLAAFCGMRIADAVAGPPAGLFAVALLIVDGQFVYCARQITTDMPAAALGLLLCLIYLRSTTMKWPAATVAGVLLALAYGLRSEYALLALPMTYKLWKTRGAVGKFAVLFAPLALLGGLTLLYNHHNFGGFTRMGYSYWCAVPYDFPTLLFNLHYIGPHLYGLAFSNSFRVPVIIAVVLLVLSFRRKASPEMRSLLEFSVLASAPLLALHLVYFFWDIRFLLLPIALAAVVAGALAANLLRLSVIRQPLFRTGFLAVLLIVAPFIKRHVPDDYYRYEALQAFDRLTPKDTVLITCIDPVYLEPWYQRGTDRYVLPMTRDVEYASKFVSPVPVHQIVPPPAGLLDQRAPGLLQAGSRDPVPYTADESIDRIAAWVRLGRPVYVDTQVAGTAAQKFLHDRLMTRFHLQATQFPTLARVLP